MMASPSDLITEYQQGDPRTPTQRSRTEIAMTVMFVTITFALVLVAVAEVVHYRNAGTLTSLPRYLWHERH